MSNDVAIDMINSETILSALARPLGSDQHAVVGRYPILIADMENAVKFYGPLAAASALFMLELDADKYLQNPSFWVSHENAWGGNADVPNLYTADSFEAAAELLMQRLIMVNCGEEGMTFEIPWGPNGGMSAMMGHTTSLVKIGANVLHPGGIRGLHVSLKIPVNAFDDKERSTAAMLNHAELSAGAIPPFAGAWSMNHLREVEYQCHIPNAINVGNCIPALSFWAIKRSKWTETQNCQER